MSKYFSFGGSYSVCYTYSAAVAGKQPQTICQPGTVAVSQYDFIYENRQSQTNCKMQNYKTLEDNVGENLDNAGGN